MNQSSQRRHAPESPPNKEPQRGKTHDHPQKALSANKAVKSLSQAKIGSADADYSGNRSQDNDKGMPPAATQQPKISVESRPGRPPFERQLTPGAADRDVARQDLRRRGSDSGEELFDNEAMLHDEDMIEPNESRWQNAGDAD